MTIRSYLGLDEAAVRRDAGGLRAAAGFTVAPTTMQPLVAETATGATAS